MIKKTTTKGKANDVFDGLGDVLDLTQGSSNGVLFLTQEFPYATDGGGAIRDRSIIDALLEVAPVELLFLDGSGSKDLKKTSPVEKPNVFEVSQILRKKESFLKRLFYLFKPYVANGYSSEVVRVLKEKRKNNQILWASRLTMGKYVRVARQLGYRVVLDEHNFESELMIKNAASHFLNWLQIPRALLCFIYEFIFCRSADVVVASSKVDAEKLRRLCGQINIYVLKNTIDTTEFENINAQKKGILFFPGRLDYYPNIAGLEWFIDFILPHLNIGADGIYQRIVVAGANPSQCLKQKLLQAGIEVYADPASMRPFFEMAEVVFVPLLSGGGTRLKIVEALAAGIPVVSTTKGAEGLELVAGADILIGDEPEIFAHHLIQLVAKPELKASLRESSRRKVVQLYDWRSLVPAVESVLRSLDKID